MFAMFISSAGGFDVRSLATGAPVGGVALAQCDDGRVEAAPAGGGGARAQSVDTTSPSPLVSRSSNHCCVRRHIRLPITRPYSY